MNLLTKLKYGQKISFSFGVLIAILVINALITTVTVHEIIRQFQNKGCIDGIIHGVEEARLLVGDYIRSPLREKTQQVHIQIRKTGRLIDSMVMAPGETSQQRMLSLLGEFQIRFQKYVIQTDQVAALKSQVAGLGKSMVDRISEAGGKLAQDKSKTSLDPIVNQVLNILWQGQVLISKGLQSQEQLNPIQQELTRLMALFNEFPKVGNDQRLLYRIQRDTRDYVGSFEKYLDYEKRILMTENELRTISSKIHANGKQLEYRTQEAIEERLVLATSLLGVLFFVFIGCAALLTRFLSREIVRPVNNLVAATQKIANGELATVVNAESDDELGELSNSFNRMAQTLQNSQTLLVEKNEELLKAHLELEQRVQERTRELAQVNQSLEGEIRSRARSEEQIRASEAKFRAMFELSPLGIVRTTLDGEILECNQSFIGMLGFPMQTTLNHFERDFSPRKYLAQEQERTESLVKTGHYGPVEKELIKRSGDRIPIRQNSVLMTLEGRGSVWSIVEDITAQKQSEEMIWNQANFDSLTGLSNRRMFQDRLHREVSVARRSKAKLGLMLLDLDKFKEVNDTLGHNIGDLLLIETAKRLKACVRESDEVARLGGDEFTFIVTNLNHAEDLDRISSNILDALTQPFTLAEQSIVIGASIGITIYPDDADTPEKLISNADQAMYKAKSEGRNCHRYFTRALQDNAVKRMKMINDLRHAIANQQLSLCYQPIVNIQSGKTYKAEALLRWNHPEFGSVSPDEFIPIAEETGLIVDIGNWVVDEVVRASHQLKCSRHHGLQISINKSPIQFKVSTQNLEKWIAKIQEVGLSGNSILIEITEGLLLDANDEVRKILYTYRDEGIQVALDDFGTGYSSLAYLNKFDIDYLKIDRAFIRNLRPKSTALALYEAIIAMAHKLGLKVIAEGIEEPYQHELLLKIGCDYGQGYLYSKPVPYAEFVKFLEQGNEFLQAAVPR